jgi:hypothetical protein
MKHVLILAIACMALSGCATRVDDAAAGSTRSVGGKQLSFQKPALDPLNGGQLVRAEDLRSGDIILSATNGITSAGIRLLTLAPVSHAAIYLGDEGVAEAVGAGIVLRPLADVLNEESVVVAFRHPKFVADHGQRIREFARTKVGGQYNHVGVVLLAPFSLERRACELPLLPEMVRDFCLRGIATIQLGAGSNDRFFCSQFVLEAYRVAGLPITDADPRWVSPADILHMREGDVPSMKIHQALVYVGHLKNQPEAVAGDRGELSSMAR